MKKFSLLLSALLYWAGIVHAQNKPLEIPLYPLKKIPNEIPGPDQESSEMREGIFIISKVRNPTLTIYLPEKNKANGTAVIICPGGGYSIVAAQHEGYDVAKKFNEAGVAAFVLKYRLPDTETSSDPGIAPLQDAQQAILTVRKNAEAWFIDPSRIGIMGFSAGGHLASTAATHFSKSYIPNAHNISLRPDFLLLIYPVISADTVISHRGSFENLLGKNASSEKLKEFSNELMINAQTPPTFLVHASDDKGVNPENSIVFYEALLKNNIPAEMHIYQNGGHGFGLKNPLSKEDWFRTCLNWMAINGLLK